MPAPDAPATATATAPDDRLRPGRPAFRRANLALFAAGVATFVLLYSTQGLLPVLSADLDLTPGQASWTASAATLGLALGLLPASALSDRYGRTAVMTASTLAASVLALALLATLVFRLLIPAARHFTPAPVDARALARTVGRHLRNPLLVRLYALGMLFMAVFGAVYNTVGYRLISAPFHLPESIAASIFVVYLVGTGTSAAAGRLSGRLGRRGALYVSVGVTSAGLLLSLADSLLCALLGLVLITAGFFAGHATASSAVGRTATEGRAQASALYLIAYYLGNSLGGTLGADAYHATGWPGAAAVGLTAMTLAAGVTLYATRQAHTTRRALADG